MTMNGQDHEDCIDCKDVFFMLEPSRDFGLHELWGFLAYFKAGLLGERKPMCPIAMDALFTSTTIRPSLLGRGFLGSLKHKNTFLADKFFNHPRFVFDPISLQFDDSDLFMKYAKDHKKRTMELVHKNLTAASKMCAFATTIPLRTQPLIEDCIRQFSNICYEFFPADIAETIMPFVIYRPSQPSQIN